MDYDELIAKAPRPSKILNIGFLAKLHFPWANRKKNYVFTLSKVILGFYHLDFLALDFIFFFYQNLSNGTKIVG